MNELKTVFVVDDEPMALRAISRLLKAEGFNTECFSSGREFIDKYNPGVVGCLIIDVMMPEVTGLEVQEWLKNSGVPLPIIFLTGKDEGQERAEAFRRGALDFLMKPVTATKLIQCIEKALDEGPKNRPRQESAIRLH